MSGRLLLAVPVAVGLCFPSAVAAADNVQNLGATAGDVLGQLESWGYNVMLNGVQQDVRYLSDRQRSGCLVRGIHPTVAGPLATGSSQTIYVDLTCPDDDQSNTSAGT